jgi:hypothetical protein
VRDSIGAPATRTQRLRSKGCSPTCRDAGPLYIVPPDFVRRISRMDNEQPAGNRGQLDVQLTAEVVSAYVSYNPIPASELAP